MISSCGSSSVLTFLALAFVPPFVGVFFVVGFLFFTVGEVGASSSSSATAAFSLGDLLFNFD